MTELSDCDKIEITINLPERTDDMLINMMEHYVDERLSERLREYDCCKCEVCVEDMKAFALNRLPPKYVSTVNGQVFTRIKQELENQPSVDLDVAIIQAIQHISASPRHGDDK